MSIVSKLIMLWLFDARKHFEINFLILKLFDQDFKVNFKTAITSKVQINIIINQIAVEKQ